MHCILFNAFLNIFSFRCFFTEKHLTKTTSLANDIACLYKSGTGSDFTIVCDGNYFSKLFCPMLLAYEHAFNIFLIKGNLNTFCPILCHAHVILIHVWKLIHLLLSMLSICLNFHWKFFINCWYLWHYSNSMDFIMLRNIFPTVIFI
jgi:hypothetical protein